MDDFNYLKWWKVLMFAIFMLIFVSKHRIVRDSLYSFFHRFYIIRVIKAQQRFLNKLLKIEYSQQSDLKFMKFETLSVLQKIKKRYFRGDSVRNFVNFQSQDHIATNQF